MIKSPVLSTRGLCKEYRVGESVVRALDGVNIEVSAGEFVCVSGRSGSGKSTLLSLLAGLESPSAGEIQILGRRIDSMDEQERLRFRRENIGFIFQLYNLMPQYTTLENVALPLAIRGVPIESREKLAMQVLKSVGLADRAEHKPTELSGGQQQRVSVARAIIAQPSLVFADEPTGNLDTKSGADLMNLLTDIFRQRGTTFILVSHDPEMDKYTDRTIVLSDGRVIENKYKEIEKTKV